MLGYTLLNKFQKRINACIGLFLRCNLYQCKIGIARSILALSTFLTLLFNDPILLFGEIKQLHTNHIFFQQFNFFDLFSHHYYVSKFSALIIIGVVISGYRPRWTCILHCWICISFNYSTMLIEGGDQIAGNLSLMLIPICLFDDRVWHWQRSVIVSDMAKLISNYALLIIKIQMCLIYFHAGVGKLSVKEWANGTAVYYWLNDPTFGITPWMHTFMDPLLSSAFGVAILSWGTIVLEIMLFMAIVMNRKCQIYFCIAGLTLHFGILFFQGLVSFFFAMASGLLFYLWVDNPLGKIGNSFSTRKKKLPVSSGHSSTPILNSI